MEFNPYRTFYEMAKKMCPKDTPKRYQEFYGGLITEMGRRKAAASEINQLILEEIWFQQNRPYYCVYPGVIKGFLNLRLDIPISQLIFPELAFAIKFAKGKEPFAFEYRGKSYPTKSMIAAKMAEEDGDEKIMIFLDIGENMPIGDGEESTIYTYIAMPVIQGMSIEEAINALPHDPSSYIGPVLPDDFRKNLVKIVAAICLLGEDVDLKEFDVLTKDWDKYQQNHDYKFIDKAIRRGKNGWLIGRRCEDEKNPSYVNPHFQHYWTGKGRTQIILKHKKGFFVKRDKLKEVPTGYEDKQ